MYYAFTAKEVATHILRYLKEYAESALGQPLRRAVITHPAYFDRNQVQETLEAAIAASFDMSLPEQMMMEPAAAALAYLYGDDRESVRVMTYDLGGGTFDVTVLERSEGVIQMKAFDGDHLLGGYNFDRAFVQWVLDRLKAAGRDIPYDESNPEDRGRRARLLQLAESFKIRLTEQRNSKVPIEFRAPDVLVDHEGRKVQILERVNREQYAEIIQDYLKTTIECCHRALDKAGIQAKDLDAILLVGGSTYGQWVVDAVHEAFGHDAEPYNPDLCVAAGAEIRASQLPPVASGEGIELVLDVPSSSPLPTINIGGKVRTTDGEDLEADAAACAGLKVFLTTPTAEMLCSVSLGAKGQFLFKDVQLLEDEPSQFIIWVSDGKGRERLTTTFTVTYSPPESTDGVSPCLPKSLYVKTSEGLQPIAEEGRPLPIKYVVRLRRVNNDSSLEIPVFQEDKEIGEIVVDNIPESAGEGSLVEITVEVTKKNKIRGTARVLTRTGFVATERPIRIEFPPIVIPTLSELCERFEALEARRQQLELTSKDSEYRVLLAGKGRRLSNQIKKLFEELEPDKQEIYSALKELDGLVSLRPSLPDFPFQLALPYRSRADIEAMATRFVGRIVGDVFHSKEHVLGIGLNSIVLEGEQRTGRFGHLAVRPVAIKIQGPLADDREVESFYRGPLTLQRLWNEASPSIRSRLVSVIGIGTFVNGEQEYGWVASELVWGQSLDRFNCLPVAYALDIILQIYEVMGFAHSFPVPVIHSDLHPGNVILQPDGLVRLVDFGSDSALYLYIVTRAIPRNYIAPELFNICSADPKQQVSLVAYEAALRPSMDVFSLGVMLHRIITRREPEYLEIHPDLTSLEVTMHNFRLN